MLVLCIAIKNIKNSELKEFDNYKWNKSSIFMDTWKLYVNDIKKALVKFIPIPVIKKKSLQNLRSLVILLFH